MYVSPLYMHSIVIYDLYGSQALDRRTAQEALRAILHAILFHRLFGTVKPQTFEVVDITMVCTMRIDEGSLI